MKVPFILVMNLERFSAAGVPKRRFLVGKPERGVKINLANSCHQPSFGGCRPQNRYYIICMASSFEHEGLVQTILSSYVLPSTVTREDAAQQLRLWAWEIMLRHDPKRGAYVTIAWRTLHSRMTRWLKRQAKIARTEIPSDIP